MREILYVDVACQLTAHKVGNGTPERIGDQDTWIAATWNNTQPKHRVYYAHEFEELIQELQHARVVVGYNSHNFDFEILRGFCGVAPRRTFDLFADLVHLTGQKLPIYSLLRGTFGGHKVTDSFHYFELWRTDQWKCIAEICADNVANIRRLHNYGLERGYIRFVDQFGDTQNVEVDWKV